MACTNEITAQQISPVDNKAVSSKSNEFSLPKLRDLVMKCVRNDGETDTAIFIEMYKELIKFIYSLGRLYGFVASDMLSKVKDISAKLKSDRINYATVQKMIQYECGDKNDQHGTRQFLWLHRANEFVVEFLQALRANVLFHNKHQFTKEEIDWKQCEYILDQWKDKETHDIVWNVYMATLSKHHSWITHQIVHVASYATPSSKEMLKIFGGDSKTNLLQLNKLTVEIIDKARQDFVNLDAYLEKMNVRLLY